jgi:histidine ammonia-lyase
MTSETVLISTDDVPVDDIVAIADGAAVVLAPEAWDRMRASRAVVDSALDRDEAVYGASTGVGHARDATLDPDSARSIQRGLVGMHAGAFGPGLPRREVRAVMAARVVGLTRGGAGASPELAEMLTEMLNRGVTPVVPRTGSVGAGDLAAHAAIGLVALAEGRAEVGGMVLDGAEALRAAGLGPLSLAPRDGLALISANGVTLGHGCLVLSRAARVLGLAAHVAAASMDAWAANPSVLDPAVQAAKGSVGQAVVAGQMRTHLSGSRRSASPRSLQDPLSFRVVPQVHGACLDVLAGAEAATTTELNARADNPLADVGSGRVISNGNFHPMLVALGFESLRVALADVIQLSDRRLGHLWDTSVEALGTEPPAAPADPGRAAGLLLRYAAAARSTRARALANPVTLDVPILDLGHEDHATNAPQAVAAADVLLDVALDVLTVEALCARGVLLASPDPTPGTGTVRILDALAASLLPLGDQPGSQDIHAAARSALVGIGAEAG